MKKQIKVALLSSLAFVGVASLVGCSNTTTTDDSDGYGTLNVAVNYQSGSKVSGVSFQMGDSVTLGYGSGETLTKNTILPTWESFEDHLGVTIEEGTDYSNTQKEDWSSYETNGFVDDDGNKLDLVMGTQTYYETAIDNGNLLAISDYIDQMPNFKKWATENSSLYDSMMSSDGNVYYTPYFDGLNDIEKMNLMNTAYVQELLDTAESSSLNTDRTISSSTISYDGDSTLFSDSNQTVTITDDSATEASTTLSVSYTEDDDAVLLQNASAATNGYIDGQTSVQCLKDALIAEYGAYISTDAGGSATGSSVIYSNLSEIFTGDNACYNVDDLVALLRCVRTNSSLLTGSTTTEITPIVPRTAQNNRTYNLAEMASWWGVRGLSGENTRLYFDTDGKLASAESNEDTYTALGYMHDLYEEGLITSDFDIDSSGSTLGSTEFRKTGIVEGTAFMVYDYNATTTQYNEDTDYETSDGVASCSNFEAVLPPVCNWTGDSTLEYDGNDVSGYFHFSEDNRSLKTGGWAIPSTCDNVTGALALMDYMFSDEGADIQNYGPDDGVYWDTSSDTDYDASWTYSATEANLVSDDSFPTISDALITAIKNSGYTWNDYYRLYVGSTQGIGHVRSSGLDSQCTFSEYGQEGLANIESAISAGGMILATTTYASNTSKFFNSVPTSISIASDVQSTIDTNSACTLMEAFWNSSQKTTTWTGASLIMDGWEATSVTSVITSKASFYTYFSEYDSVFVSAYQTGFDDMDI